MQRDLVLTLIGPDRPGLVEAISTAVLSHDANWLESRMAHLGGQFAGLLRVQVPEDRADDLAAALSALGGQGLHVVVEQAGEAAPPAGAGTHKIELELVGQDRPGIVRHVAAALAELSVNVESLDSDVSSAPMSGEKLFKAHLLLSVPREVGTRELKEALDRVAHDLVIDTVLEEHGLEEHGSVEQSG